MKKRKALFRTLVFTSGTIIGSLLGCAYHQNSVDQGLLLSNDAIKNYSFNADEEFEYVSVSPSIRNWLVDNNILNEELSSTEENIEKGINTRTLSKLTEIQFSAVDTNDYSFLNYCTDLRTLKISEPFLLSDKEIDLLNSFDYDIEIVLDSKSVDYLSFSDVDLNKLNNWKFVLDSTKEEEVVLLDKYESKLIESLGEEEVNSLKELNSWLDEIISKLEISSTDDEYDKVLKISYYLCSHLTYDVDVASTDDFDIKHVKLSNKYNRNPLLSLKEQTDENGIDSNMIGICINYATLFNTLCRKCDVKSIRVTGDRDDYGIGHAWNKVIYSNNIFYKDCYVIYSDNHEYEYDITSFDATNNEFLYKELYDSCYSDNYNIKNNSKLNISGTLEPIFKLESDEEFIDKDKRVELKMYNEKVENKKVEYTAEELESIKNKIKMTYISKYLFSIVSGSFGGVIALGCNNHFEEKRKKRKKEKKLTRIEN